MAEGDSMMDHESHGSKHDPVKLMEHFDRAIENMDPAKVQKVRDDMAAVFAKGGQAGDAIKTVLGIGLKLLL